MLNSLSTTDDLTTRCFFSLSSNHSRYQYSTMQSAFITSSRILFLTLVLASCGRDKTLDDTINIGTIETINSKLLNEDRTVWVHVPDNERTDSTRYPVLYL